MWGQQKPANDPRNNRHNPQYANYPPPPHLCANTGLSKHGDPVFPHFWSWNQNLARVCARGGGGYRTGRH